jgi:hypothetical protein
MPGKGVTAADVSGDAGSNVITVPDLDGWSWSGPLR